MTAGTDSTAPGRLPTGTVTFLFSDIEGSTRLAAAAGPRFPALLDRHHALLRLAFGDHGGTEVGTEGDAFFVVFRAAGEAVRAAVAAQRALAAEPWPDRAAVRVRMGIHTGAGTLGGDNYAGLDVHVAARISAAAHGGQVLVSGPTHALVAHDPPDGVSFRDLGEHRLKDLEDPEQLVELVIAGLHSSFPAPRTLEIPTNLPAEVTRFVGRQADLAAVGELLEKARLVTLTGPGGTGKTRLSLAVASATRERYPNGVFLVELAPIVDSALVASTIASVVGVREEAARPIAASLREHLKDRRLLLVLDNVEQVVTGATVVADLLRTSPGLRVLATSRIALGISGEHLYPVPLLRVPDVGSSSSINEIAGLDAVALFVDRARAVRAGFELTTENAAAIAAICARLDGLPLAIELAAARTRLYAPAALLRHLDRSLAVLTGGGRDRPERQQTLRGAIDWSFELLGPAERVLFRRLAVFAGGAAIESAAAVCDADGDLGLDVADGLAALVDQSLMGSNVDGLDEPRFRMLQTIREYATERLAQSADADLVPRRHAEVFARLAAEAEPHLLGDEQAAWLDRLDRELDNLRAALAWAADHELQLALSMVGALWRFWQQRSHLEEGRRIVTDLLARPGAAPPSPARARALDSLGGITYWQGDFKAAETAYAEQLATGRLLDDQVIVAEGLYNLGYALNVLGREDEGRSVHEEALKAFAEQGDELGVARVREGLAYSHHVREEWQAASLLIEANLATFRAVGDRFRTANALEWLAVIDQSRGRFVEARASLAEALGIFRSAGDVPGVLNALLIGAATALSAGDPAAAARICGAVAAQHDKLGDLASLIQILRIPDPEPGARVALGEEDFEREHDMGRAISIDDAVELAASGVSRVVTGRTATGPGV